MDADNNNNGENNSESSPENPAENTNIAEANVGTIQNIENVAIHRQTLLDYLNYLPHIVIGLIGIIALAGIGYMLFGGDKEAGKSFISGDAAAARGLITFLVAVVTIAIAIILTLSAVLSNAQDFKERFSLGKEVLTLLIGVLGTIIGFYFGAADKTTIVSAAQTPSAVTSLQISAPNLTNEQVTDATGTIITAFVSGGKLPYKFKVTFNTSLLQPIEGISNDGVIKAEVKKPASGFEKDTEVAYQIEVTDAENKKGGLSEDKAKKFVVKVSPPAAN